MRTIQETINALRLNEVGFTTGFKGKPLVPQMISPSDIANVKIDDKYQRTLSKAKIKDAKQLDLSLLQGLILCKRPDSLGSHSGLFAPDTQHQCVLVVLSEIDFPVLALVYEHDENATLDECRKVEAEMFYQINKYRKKISTIESLRAGCAFGEEEAIKIEGIMMRLNVECDGFGSDSPDAIELKSFTHFFEMTKTDGTYANDEKLVKNGLNLWRELWGDKSPNPKKEKTITGVLWRSLAMIDRFKQEVLQNGKRKMFENYLVWYASGHKQLSLTKGYGNFDADRYVLHGVIQGYNDWVSRQSTAKSLAIGEETLKTAIAIDKRMQHPDVVENQVATAA